MSNFIHHQVIEKNKLGLWIMAEVRVVYGVRASVS